MAEITSLIHHKQKLLNQKVLEDINNILLVLDYTERALALFKYYKPIKELIATLEANKKLFELHKKKYAKNSQ